METTKPLVSICIPTSNSEKHLRYCLDSVLAQTYDNIEILANDNNSTDSSFDILREYEDRQRHSKDGCYMNVSRTKRDVGHSSNVGRAAGGNEGRYLLWLSPEDALKPDMVERCVELLEKNNDAGMVLVHCENIDENGKITQAVPYFDQDKMISGAEMGAALMMDEIASPSQRFLRKEAFLNSGRYKNYGFQEMKDRFDAFCVAMVADCAFLSTPLCERRVASKEAVSDADMKLLGIFEEYQFLNAAQKIAISAGYNSCSEKFDEAVKALGEKCIRYAERMLRADQKKTARRYLYLSTVFDEKIEATDDYKRVWELAK